MSSFTNNTIQVDFDVVYILLNDGMMSMFHTLEASGLKGFLDVEIKSLRKVLMSLSHMHQLNTNLFGAQLEG